MSSAAPLSVRWVHAALAAFLVGVAIFWPRVFLVVDEERYVSQAVAFANGGATVPGADIILPPRPGNVISNYPPGTSLLQTPLVRVFGWRAAVLLSVMALVVATLTVMRWLRESGRNPAFALMIPGSFACAFFGRMAMSDMPATALVAMVCWLLWGADAARPLRSALTGFLCGAAALFREPLLVLLAPLVVGALVRRQTVAWTLIAGGAVAIALRLGTSALLFGSPLYVRDSGYGFSVSSLVHSVPLYGFILLVMLPGAAVTTFLYRGPRRAELLAAFVAYVALFLLYEYDSIRDNGSLKGLVLASRFMAPLAPIVAFMSAEAWPPLYARVRARLPGPAYAAAVALGAGAIATAFLVHPLARRQEGEALRIVRGIYAHTRSDVPVVTNSKGTLKYLSPAYGPRRLVLLEQVPADAVFELTRQHRGVSVVVLDRNDSEMFRADAANTARFLAVAAARCDLVPRFREGFGWAELRVFDLQGCRAQ